MNVKLWKKILPVLIILVAAFYISNHFYQFMLIQGDSMSPTYHNMQLAILDRHSRDYTYGDVIAFQCDALKEVLVKRVVACPGDDVCILNGKLYVNNFPNSVYDASITFEYAGIAGTPIQLGQEQFFVIGDNVAESKDSRYEVVGVVEKESVLGKIVIFFW